MNAIGKNLPQVFGAYSTFLLYKGYQGPLLRVRRTEDNVEVDVFPDSTGKVSLNSYVNSDKSNSNSRNLGNFACATGYQRDSFVGINVSVELRVTKVYNQGFNRSNDLVQTTTSSQPIIFISNTLKSNQLGPSIFFDNTSFQISNLPQNFTYHTCIKPLTSKNYTSTYFQNSTANIKGFSTFSTSTNIFSAKVAGALNRGVGIDNLYSYNKQQIEDKAYGDIQINQSTAPLKERFLTFEFESDTTLYNTNDYTISPYGDVNFIVIYDDQTTPISRNNAVRRRETSQLLAEYNQDLFNKLNKFYPQSVLNKYPSPKFAFACKSLTGKFGGTLQPLVEVHRSSTQANRVIVYADSKGEISLDSQVTVSAGVSNATTLGQFCAAPTYANPDNVAEATIITYKLINQVDSIDSTDYAPVLITAGINTAVLYNPTTKLQKIETYAPLFNSIATEVTYQMNINNGGTQSVIGVYESNINITGLMTTNVITGSKNLRLSFNGKGPYYLNTSATSYYVPAIDDYPTTLGNEVTLTSFVRSDSGRYVVRTNGKLFKVPGNQSPDDLLECPLIGPIRGKLAAIIGYDCDISNFEEALSNELQLQFLIKKSQIKSLLNTYTGAAAAYSVRLINKSTPYAMRVRRASDNTELNIGFTSVGQLDTTALTNFCTGTNCFVRTWYDQSTNANHAIQTTTANQPKIYDSITGVVLDEDNGLPAALFVGSYLNSGSVSATGTATNFAVANISGGSSNRALFFTPEVFNLFNGVAWNFLTISSQVTYNAASFVTLGLHYFGANSTQGFGALNGASVTTNAQAAGSGTKIAIGTQSTNSIPFFGYVQECIYYASDKTANRTGIEQNINAFYGIYWDGTQTGLLDTYPGAAAAYSLRALNSAYTGPLVRVRRASDNAEQDIYAKYNGELDIVALTTFCAGTDGFVKTWYDQSGNTRNAGNATAANQPKIYDSSTGVIEENGKPALVEQSRNLILTAAYTGAASCTVVSVAFIPAGFTKGLLIASGANQFLVAENGSASSPFNGVGTPTVYVDGASATFTTRDEVYDALVVKQSLIFASANLSSFIDLDFGQNTNTGSFAYQELIIYNSDKSSNRTGIEANINEHYNMYWDGSQPGILENYMTNMAAGYMLAAMSSSYTGPLIRVRRASDNTEQDIYANYEGDLNTSSLTTFCTGTDCFIRTWYDQSGNANNLTQTTTGNQPKIYDASTGVLTLGSVGFEKPALLVNSKWFDWSTPVSFTNLTFFTVTKKSSTAGTGSVIFYQSSVAYGGDDVDNQGNPRLGTTSGVIIGNSLSNTTVSGAENTHHISYYHRNGTSADGGLNGEVKTPASPVNTAAFTVNDIFNYGGTYTYDGQAQAIIMYSASKSADRSAIESALNDYFNVY